MLILEVVVAVVPVLLVWDVLVLVAELLVEIVVKVLVAVIEV